MKCKAFTALACVDGNCPIALHDICPDQFEKINCEECFYNTKQCTECIFKGTEYCDQKEDK